jgi:glycosyltransferase involved in cell wall biosynthesis
MHWPSFFYYNLESRARTLFELTRFLADLRLARARGARVVWTAHNLYPHDGGRDVWAHRVARSAVVSGAEAIIAHGPAACAEVAREFAVPPERLVDSPHGHWIGRYPNEISRPRARAELGLDEKAYVYAFIGLCKPYKGLDALVEAFAAQPPDTALVVAGRFQSSEYQSEIEAAVGRLDSARVRFHPEFVPDEELQRIFVAADAVVLPYRRILTSGTVMAALSFGRPVVVPSLGGLADVVDDRSGVLYDPAEPGALAAAMSAIRERAFSEPAILAYAKSFRWEDAARVLIEILER